MAKPGKLRVRDNEDIPEVYSNKIIGSLFDGACVAVTLGVMRTTPTQVGEGASEPPPPPAVHVVERLALSPSAAVELHDILHKMIATLSRPTDPQKAN